jgi:DNA-binding response OmpR family regulator
MAIPGDRASWLAEGATDVMLPPFEVAELFLRLQARLRHGGSDHRRGGVLSRGAVELDLDRSEWREDGRRIHLTPLEAALLECLLETPGQVVPMQRLLVEGLGHASGQGSPEAVRNHIRNLRAKLERRPAEPPRLRNIPGIGYMFLLPDDPIRSASLDSTQTFT